MAYKFDLAVVMPSFNQGSYIEEAIRSVIFQRGVNVQLIVMDGGSSDNTVDILNKYSAKITFRSEADNGQSHALNKALSLVDAPVTGWLNSDDKYLPGSFRRALKVLALNPEVSLVHGHRVLIDATSRIVGWGKPGPFSPASGRFNICSETAFWRSNCIPGHTFREELAFAMDVHFLGSIAKDRKTMYIPVFQGCFRCHDDSKSSTLWETAAVPEGTSVWSELFSTQMNLSRDYAPRSLVSKVLDFVDVPLSISTNYVVHRLLRGLRILRT